MSKRVKILVSALVVVLLLTVGATATVMAQEDPTPTPQAEAKGLLARVAEILDIPQEELVDAFRQAQQEIRQEAFIRFLNKAVENGRITQEEANEIEEWWEQKPEALESVQGFNERCRVRLQKREALGLAQSFRERCWLRLHKLTD